MSRFVRRVTRDTSAHVHVVDTQHTRTASVASATTPPSPAPPVPDPSQVFDKLEQIFSFIGGALTSVRLTDEVDDPPVPPGPDSLAGKLGEELMDRVFDCVYTDCLSHIAQSSDTSWPTLDKISQLAGRFQTNISRHLQLQVNHNSLYHVYRSRYDKPPLAARCCHVANDLTNFTGDRQTNERTDEQDIAITRVHPPHLRAED